MISWGKKEGCTRARLRWKHGPEHSKPAGTKRGVIWQGERGQIERNNADHGIKLGRDPSGEA